MDRRSFRYPVKAADVPALKCDAAVPGGLDDRHPVGRPVDVIGGKGEPGNPSFSRFVNPYCADGSPKLDTVDTFRFHNIIDYASNSRCLRCFKRALLASEKEIC